MSQSVDERVEIARKLFAAWSSGDVDAPAEYLHEDATLYDVPRGEYKGWPAIRAFFGMGLKTWPDLEFIPEEFWTNEDGVALTWVMTAGPWRAEGMSYLLFEAGKVSREVDYYTPPPVPVS